MKASLLLCVALLTSSSAFANGDSRPRQTGAVQLGQDAFKPERSAPPQQFRPPAAPADPRAVRLPDPDLDAIVGLVSMEQLRDIISRTEKPEDRRMLQRAVDKLMLLERERGLYVRTMHLLLDSYIKAMDAKSKP